MRHGNRNHTLITQHINPMVYPNNNRPVGAPSTGLKVNSPLELAELSLGYHHQFSLPYQLITLSRPSRSSTRLSEKKKQ